MRLYKPKVEYKLALQEKPQGSILTYYYKTNNLTRINWLNTRLIIASNKIRHEIPFKTKRVKYTEIWKKSIKIVKESKPSFFLHCAQCLTYPSLFKFLLFSLHHHHRRRHISIVSPPPPPPHFYCFPSTTTTATFLLFFFLLLLLPLLVSIVFPRKAKEAKIRPKRPRRPNLEGKQ